MEERTIVRRGVRYKVTPATEEQVRKAIEQMNNDAGEPLSEEAKTALSQSLQPHSEIHTVVAQAKYYGLKLLDPTLDLEATVPELSIIVKDGDCYWVAIPSDNEASVQMLYDLENQGKLCDPSPEQVARLNELFEEAGL